MAKPQQAPLPQELLIGYGYTVEFDAIDPATGASVAGVQVSGVLLTATDTRTGKPETLTVGPYMLTGGPSA